MLEWAERDGGKTALIEGQREVSYAELATATEDVARLLKSRGVRAGDRVMIVGENGIGTVIFLLAAQRLDAWPAMVNARLPRRDIEEMRNTIAARLTVCIVGNSPAAASVVDETFADADLAHVGSASLGWFDNSATTEPVYAESNRQVGLLLFSSGTTGRPKAVMVSHLAMLNAGTSLIRTRGLGRDDVFYGLSPVSHIMGGSAILTGVLWAGATVKLVPRLDLADLAESIASGVITCLMGVPMVYARLISHIGMQGIDISGHRLRSLMSGGSPLDPTLARHVAEMFGIPISNCYAMTECSPIARTPHGVPPADGSVGLPEGDTEIRLVMRDQDVAQGEVGEILVRGPSLMIGYYRDAPATAAAISANGWFATGDLGRRIGDGELQIVGRSKDVIIRSGFNVYPAEVEAALLSHPAIGQCAVVGRAGDYGNEEVIAFVQLHPRRTATEQQIAEYVSDLLAPYKRPAQVVIVQELPVGPTGKILKGELAKRAVTI